MIEGFWNSFGSYDLTMKYQIENVISKDVKGAIKCGQSVLDNNWNSNDHYGNPSPEHFYSFTLSTPQTVLFEACESDFDIAIYNEDKNQIA